MTYRKFFFSSWKYFVKLGDSMWLSEATRMLCGKCSNTEMSPRWPTSDVVVLNSIEEISSAVVFSHKLNKYMGVIYRYRFYTISCTCWFQVITDPIKGLIFMSRHDRKRLTVDPSLDTPGSNSTRTIIFSDRYDHVVLYDHIIRAKI